MIRRISPLDMSSVPDRTAHRNGWGIALSYAGERQRSSLFVVDMSHIPQWILYAGSPDELWSVGLNAPQNYGEVVITGDLLIVRLTATEYRVMALGHEHPSLSGIGIMDVSDGFATFGLVGSHCLDVLSKLSPVDLEAPGQPCPCAAQAPVEDIPCLIVRLKGNSNIPGLIISVARGYGQSLLDIFLDAGREYGISVAGWERFQKWLSM